MHKRSSLSQPEHILGVTTALDRIAFGTTGVVLVMLLAAIVVALAGH